MTVNIGYLSASFVLPPCPDTTLREIVGSDSELKYLAELIFGRRCLDMVVFGRPALTAHLLRVDQPATTREVYDLLRCSGFRPGNRLTGLMVALHCPAIFYEHSMRLLGGRRAFDPGYGAVLYPQMGYGCDRGRGCRDCGDHRAYMCIECLYSRRVFYPSDRWSNLDDFLVVRRAP
jgi:hypothetical protein